MTTNLDAMLAYAPKISLRSRILHTLGCLLIGTPSSMGMPDDFYFIEADREFPKPDALTWNEKRKRIYTDGFRRALTQKTALYACLAALVFSIAGYALNGGVRGVKRWVESKPWSSSPVVQKKNLAQCRQEYQDAVMRGDAAAAQRVQSDCKDVAQ